MSVPKVVIVGRPNVGKSSMLNWLSAKRISVVEPTAGVTRDRVTYLMHVGDRYFELVDTGGIGIVDSDDLSADIERQIQTGLKEADLILFVVDGSTGVVPLDIDVARRLRSVNKPLLLVINKCDSPKQDDEAAEFYRLVGDAPALCTSVIGNRNRDELLDLLLEHLPAHDGPEDVEGARLSAEPELKLAIVGRRNVGKSTFINALAQTERMIVSEIAGTTRDSVDVRFELDGKSFIAIDTPGVRKRKSLANDIEYYGLLRAKRSIRRADVVFMFFDALQTISMVDKQLVSEISENFKPAVFVVNKWDLAARDMTMEAWSKYLIDEFSFMRHVPIAFITAKDERNIKKLINLAQTIAKQARLRVSTSVLNGVVRRAVLANRPHMRANRVPKVLFATQVATEPPTIVLKCNDPKLFDRSWTRYLLGVLREKLPFKEVPIKLYLRGRPKDLDTDVGLEEADESDLRLTEDRDDFELENAEESNVNERFLDDN